jgi:hypothetical protein
MVPHKLCNQLYYSLVHSPHLLTLLIISSNPRLQVFFRLQNIQASRETTEEMSASSCRQYSKNVFFSDTLVRKKEK